ncbi:MAG: cysteine--tRNA ligase [Candidatus Colwellbacteria bacterium RIFCSPLOWO2_01_FULL_48_10]|uniref:Cysteine--tRNA ligase n=2 Tax=Bacteria candidate phyla TaxID=1783234 RepID=A0A1F5P268_9BACT|nr:MAG: cysteine--tRNA ligase [Candidatus Doudnabacteria bacterium RIFCSPHIGHO2_01_FULL_49_9]OGY59334.1 MAG: cysteine--tRNA ligase [Candidatus Colwellbacteria bacterium RIFCSPLOWO2_01_FULL_48_10]
MHIFDTLSGRAESVSKAKRIKMFVCGPTVYDEAHIGHARTYVFFDAAIRYLRSRGWKLFYLQNITDIDDKIIKRAAELGIAPKSLAGKFAKSYLADMKALGVTSVDKYAYATKFIPQIVCQVKALAARGYAYRASDGYYFDIAKFKDYGKLSRRSAEQAESSVSRIDEGIDKKNKGDFCLWKLRQTRTSADLDADQRGKAEEPFWRTELGTGRPGWHIEDTAITEKFFGPQYDIHGGGVDLKFPHHEAEIAQQEAASGKEPFVKIWMHTGLLFVDGQKMSKSLNNFTTIKDFLAEHDARVFRMMVLLHHYRSNMNYTDALLEQSFASLQGIEEFVDKMDFVARKSVRTAGSEGVGKLPQETEEKFNAALEKDFNTPEALAAIFHAVSLGNNVAWQMTPGDAKRLGNMAKKLLNALGLEVRSTRLPFSVRRMIIAKDRFRIDKQFIQSDALRKKLESLGYKVEDTPLGSFVRKK